MDCLKWYDRYTSGFEFTGTSEISTFYRISSSKMHLFRQPVQDLAKCTSGVRLRFRTDSKRIALSAKLLNAAFMPHMPRTGSCGFDLYVTTDKEKTKFILNFRPNTATDTDVSGECIFPSKGIKDIVIYFPLYNGVRDLSIGLEKDSVILPPSKEQNKLVLFYGSSITQGGCGSRPGNSYPAILCRDLNLPFINLGFSGNALGELEMAEYIKSLKPNVFVMDYDHNASLEGLTNTHEDFFKAIRKDLPDIPIILMSKPDFDPDPETNSLRRNVIINTYENAKRSGDRNVYFIDGESLFGDDHRDACTVDGCHPNDLGFMRMAIRLKPVVEKALN